jgi:hypothetical protein
MEIIKLEVKGAEFTAAVAWDGNGWHGFLTTQEEDTTTLVSHFYVDFRDDLHYIATGLAERYVEGLEIALVQSNVPVREF